MKYSIYILTAFDTEITREFKNKKELFEFCKKDLYVRVPDMSKIIRTFSLDKEEYKTVLETTYSKEVL